MIHTIQSPIHGTGLATSISLQKGDSILYVLIGEKFTQEQYEQLGLENPYLLAYRQGRYIYSFREEPYLSLNKLRYVNHSDTPNCYIKRGWLIAKEDIEPNTELTIRYHRNHPMFNNPKQFQSIYRVSSTGQKGIRGKYQSQKSSRVTYSPFNLQLAQWIYQFYLSNSHLVVDPFAGWGERAKVVGNTYYGVDINPQAIEYASQCFKVNNILDDSRYHSFPPHNGLLTCPPYFNLEKYSTNGIDYIRDYSKFLEALTEVFANVSKSVDKGACYCVVVGNFRVKGVFYPLVYDTMNIMRGLGFTLWDEVVLDSSRHTSRLTFGNVKYGYTCKVHQTLLVFKNN